MGGVSVLIGPSPDGLRIVIYTRYVAVCRVSPAPIAEMLLHLESGHRLFIVNGQDSTVTNRFPAKPGQLKHIVVQAKTGNLQHLRDMPIGNPLVAGSSPPPTTT
jgi:hypothetical protein